MRMPLTIAATLLVTACNRPAEETTSRVSDAAAPLAAALVPLQPRQIADAALRGELACIFIDENRAGPFLLARGNVADSDGHADAIGSTTAGPVRLEAQESGGFDAMLDGIEFAGEDHSHVVILIPGGVPKMPDGGTESPPIPARLAVTMPDGSSITLSGEWICGP